MLYLFDILTILFQMVDFRSIRYEDAQVRRRMAARRRA